KERGREVDRTAFRDLERRGVRLVLARLDIEDTGSSREAREDDPPIDVGHAVERRGSRPAVERSAATSTSTASASAFALAVTAILGESLGVRLGDLERHARAREGLTAGAKDENAHPTAARENDLDAVEVFAGRDDDRLALVLPEVSVRHPQGKAISRIDIVENEAAIGRAPRLHLAHLAQALLAKTLAPFLA